MSVVRLSPEEPDPIDSGSREELRVELLRLRDQALGAESRCEVLADRVAELEGQNHELDRSISELARSAEQMVQARDARISEIDKANQELDKANQELHVELGRSPVIRVARAVARRLGLR